MREQGNFFEVFDDPAFVSYEKNRTALGFRFLIPLSVSLSCHFKTNFLTEESKKASCFILIRRKSLRNFENNKQTVGYRVTLENKWIFFNIEFHFYIFLRGRREHPL